MLIRNDSDLEAAVDTTNELLRAIHAYSRRDFSKQWTLEFPRGYVRTASQHRKRLPFIRNRALKDNIAYTFMAHDTLHWVLMRTDVAATIREQLIKLSIFLVGGLAESITKHCLHGKCGKTFTGRTSYMVRNGIIAEGLCADLDWVWEIRNRMHLFLLDESEYNVGTYTAADYDRATRTIDALLASLT